MKKFFNIILYLFIINIVYSEYIWQISFYDEEDSFHNNPNNFNITKGNYKTIKILLTYKKNNTENITHINTLLTLNHSELKMLPNELNINTEESLEYNIDLGVPCNIDNNSLYFNFELEDNNIKDLIEINECKANLFSVQKIINVSFLNGNNITNNLISKIFIKQDFKNFEKIEIQFSSSTCIFLRIINRINNIIINEYNLEDLFLFYYSDIKSSPNPIRRIEDKGENCNITINIKSNNNKCFGLSENSKNITIFNKTLDEGSKGAFYHNSLVSSYIDNDNKEENNDILNFYFYKEVFYLSSFCVIQDINNDFLSDYEILNQRVNYTHKNIFYDFYNDILEKDISEPKITFKNLNKNLNYKIKCIFDFFDDKEKIIITYGDGMIVPIKINLNETKSNLEKNCYKSNDTELDTRKCDVINGRLTFKVLYDLSHSYKLNNVNYTDLYYYNNLNIEEKIEYLKNIIDGNISIISSENELISTLSDYLFLIDCKENKICKEEKNIIFKNILIKFKEKFPKLDINSEQYILNDVFLFNNIIENTDCINYDNLDYMVNNVFTSRNYFYSNATKIYNQYLTNYFLIMYDKFISIITKHKTLYKDKLEIDKDIKVYKSPILVDFYNFFINWISHGMINREDKFIGFCQNLIANYIETPVLTGMKTIIDTETIKITGFDTEQSQKLYKNIYSAGAISYKKFPLFSLDNKKSEAITFFLFTDLRDNYEKQEIAYSEAFKIIFKKKKTGNYCYLWNNNYKTSKDEKLVNNYIFTEYLDKDSNNKYDINCVSRIMISPMTVILGQKDIKGNIFKEGISFLSVIVIVFITLCLIIISLPFILSKFYKKQDERSKSSVSELNNSLN